MLVLRILQELITVLTLPFATEEYSNVVAINCLFRIYKLSFKGWEIRFLLYNDNNNSNNNYNYIIRII